MDKLSDFSTIIIVADNIVLDNSSINDVYTRTADRALSDNVTNLAYGFKKIFDNVIVYDDLRLFIDEINKHKNAIVFPYWHGEKSRNKQSLVASICEAYNIVYIGADTYTNIVCCDKILAKDICRMADIPVPRSIIVNNQIKEIDLSYLMFPIIIKPVYEGSSVGITQDNIFEVNNRFLVVNKINQLISHLNQPIIVEEFVRGKEISISMVGWGNNVKVIGAVERYCENDPNYFDYNLHSYSDKILDTIKLKNAKMLLSQKIINNLSKLFNWLDKVEYIRIDGKFINNEFVCFELSQDASLNPHGAFFKALSYEGYTYEDALRLLVNNCLERYNNQYPNLS